MTSTDNRTTIAQSVLGRTGILLLVSVALMISGCKSKSTDNPSRPDGESSEKPVGVPGMAELPFDYLKARREFVLADFFKPAEGSAEDDVVYMAPLIVREVGGAEHDEWFLGAELPAVYAADLPTTMPASERVVYFYRDEVIVGDWAHQRLTYLWVMRQKSTNEQTWCGIRQIRGLDGRTIISEVIGDDRAHREVFVAQSVEDKAWIQFGKPLPKRLNATEASFESHPNTFVVRVISDGPQPMGPFVYLEPDGRSVTTLLCRCMTSQYEAVRENAYYQLRPLDEASLDTLPLSLSGIAAVVSGSDGDSPLSEALRIPTME